MADGSSVVGSIILNPDLDNLTAAPNDICFIPALKGTRFFTTPALRPTPQGAGIADYYAWSQGITLSYIDVQTYLYGGATHNWFTFDRMNAAFRADTATGLIQDLPGITVPGDLSTVGLGPCQFSLAQSTLPGPATDDGTAVLYRGCKFDNLRLTLQAGRPIIARFRIWLFGAPTTAIANVTTAAPSGPVLVGHAMTYTGIQGAASVYGGEIRIQSNLMPDLTNLSAIGASSGKCYPQGFYNDQLPLLTFDATIKKGAITVADDDQTLRAPTITFKKIGPATVMVLTASTLAPDISKDVDLGLALISRSYTAVSASKLLDTVGHSSFGFAAS